MKTYKEDGQELLNWAKVKTKEINDKIPWEGGLDGKLTEEHHKLHQEFMKRLKELKKKHNIK